MSSLVIYQAANPPPVREAPENASNDCNSDDNGKSVRSWISHSTTRAILSGIGYVCFSSSKLFISGCVYGGTAVLVNLATLPIFDALSKRIQIPSIKALIHLTGTVGPWAASFFILNKIHNDTGNSLFNISSDAAIGLIIVHQIYSAIFGSVNKS